MRDSGRTEEKWYRRLTVDRAEGSIGCWNVIAAVLGDDGGMKRQGG